MSTAPTHRPQNAGTIIGYRDNGCRCPECRDAWRTHAQTLTRPKPVAAPYDPWTDKGCIEPGCVRSHYAKQRCERHYRQHIYQQWRLLHPIYVNPTTCTHPGCTNRYYHSGYCRKHYDTSTNTERTCTKPGCNTRHLAKGLCRKHYDEQSNATKPRQDRSNRPRRLCTHPNGCTSTLYARGYCSQHYREAWGTKPTPKPTKTCSIPDCDLPHRGLGYCNKHYLANRRAQGIKPVHRAADN